MTTWNVGGIHITEEQVKIAKANGLTHNNMYSRLVKPKNKWTVEKAISTPIKKKPENGHVFLGHFISNEQAKEAEENGIPLKTIHSRIKAGKSVEQAIKKKKKSGRIIDGKKITEEQIRISEENGIEYHALYTRVRDYGMSIEDAIRKPVRPYVKRKEKKKKEYPAKMLVGKREIIVSYWDTKEEAEAEEQRLKEL